MTLWRIKDGVPSIADALLTVGGLLGVGLSFVPCIEWLLDFFEPRGLEYLGYLIAVLGLLGAGALVIWLFVRNQKKLRAEVIVPRGVFALSAPAVISLVRLLTDPWAQRAGVGFFAHFALLVICFVPIFGVVVRYALRSPKRAMVIAFWFYIALLALGVLARLAGAILRW